VITDLSNHPEVSPKADLLRLKSPAESSVWSVKNAFYKVGNCSNWGAGAINPNGYSAGEFTLPYLLTQEALIPLCAKTTSGSCWERCSIFLQTHCLPDGAISVGHRQPDFGRCLAIQVHLLEHFINLHHNQRCDAASKLFMLDNELKEFSTRYRPRTCSSDTFCLKQTGMKPAICFCRSRRCWCWRIRCRSVLEVTHPAVTIAKEHAENLNQHL